MTRVVKDAEERRDELLDTALTLFLDHGYERTSVEQITSAVGVAKGTFYHYFTTKQDLLEQLVTRYSNAVFAKIDDALQNTSGSAPDRFRMLIRASNSEKLGRKEETLLLTSSLYAEENRALLHGICEGWMERTRPLIHEIVEQGIEEGTFDVPDADMVTELCLSIWFDYGIRAGRRFFEAGDEQSRVDAFVGAIDGLVFAEERVLGAAPGSLSVDVRPAVSMLFRSSD